MKRTLLTLLLFTSMTSYGSDCLNIEEQKKLGSILIQLDEAVAQNPGCLDMYRGGSCLPPSINNVKEFLEDKLKSCSTENKQ